MEPGDPFKGIVCREWGTKEFDTFLLRFVPAGRLAEVRAHIRPLADETEAKLREHLFRGVKRPFHYRLATGWLGTALRAEDGKDRLAPVERLAEKCGWGDDTVVFLVFHPVTYGVLTGRWARVRDYLRLGWLDTSYLVICADESKWAAIYYDDYGPLSVDRGNRRLLTPA